MGKVFSVMYVCANDQILTKVVLDFFLLQGSPQQATMKDLTKCCIPFLVQHRLQPAASGLQDNLEQLDNSHFHRSALKGEINYTLENLPSALVCSAS